VSAPPLASPVYGPDAPKWRLARFLRAFVAPPVLALYRTRFLGAENVPASGGFVLAGNHVSDLDPALLWAGVPRLTHFFAKQELFATPVVGWVLPRVYVLPINRGNADRVAIQRATDLLAYGEPVGIFPEGTRQSPGTPSDEPTEAHSGVAFIAMRAGVPVVPVGIAGTERALPKGAKIPRFPRVTIRYGEPVRPEDFTQGGRKERTQAMTAEIMRRIAVARSAAEKE
jgi:1-acyl-sn-glycerol-3-phosphate acyltransferase